MARILGLDIGDRRIGVAISDPTGILASPLTIIERADEGGDVRAVLAIIKERDVSRIIAGLPRSMDGGVRQQAEKVQVFVSQLRQHTAVPVEFRDERLTTVAAMRLKHEGGRKRSGRKARQEKPRYDAMAAALILQGYLDEKTAGNYQI